MDMIQFFLCMYAFNYTTFLVDSKSIQLIHAAYSSAYYRCEKREWLKKNYIASEDGILQKVVLLNNHSYYLVAYQL